MGTLRAFLLLIAGFILGFLGFYGWYTQCSGSYCTLTEQLMVILPLAAGVIIAFFSLAALAFYWMTSPKED